MADRQALPRTRKQDGVGTDDVPRPQAGDSDFSAAARALADASGERVAVRIEATHSRGRLRECERRSRWRVDLVLVMGLDDLDVELRGQRAGRDAHELLRDRD